MAPPRGRRGRPPKIVDRSDTRIADLDAREKRLALEARARKRYTLDLPVDLYASLIEQAEAWHQPLPDVVRACMKKGLEVIKQFGTASANPWMEGMLNPPSQADIDPTGLAWPPTGPTQSIVLTPQWAAAKPVNAMPTHPLMPNGFTPTPTEPAAFSYTPPEDDEDTDDYDTR